MAEDLVRVVGGERHDAARAERNAAAGRGAGLNEQNVRAHAGDRRLQRILRALADLHHGDDGGHADQNAQRRQGRTRLVACQRLESDGERARQNVAERARRGRRGPAPPATCVAAGAVATPVCGGAASTAVAVDPPPFPEYSPLAASDADDRRPFRQTDGNRRDGPAQASRDRSVTVSGRRRPVILDPAVANADDPLRVLGDRQVVRHQDDRDSRGVQILKHPQDLFAGPRVEVSGRLVGEQQRTAD